MGSIRKSLLLSVGEKYFLALIALGSSMILARLLTPREIGMYSVALGALGIAHMLRDIGISSYLIQTENASPAVIRSALGLSVCLSWSMCLLVYGAAPWVADFYETPEMTTLIRVVAINFLVAPLGGCSLALLRREMRIGTISAISISAAVIGTLVGIGGALSGLGPYALAYASVSSTVWTGFAAMAARGRSAAMLPSLSGWGAIWSFGSRLVGANLINYLSNESNDLILGKALGLAPAALISKALGLVNLFQRDMMAAIRNVVFPELARRIRTTETPESFFVVATSNVAVVAWPFYFFIAAFAEQIVHLMFGSQWTESARLVPYLALAGAIGTLNSLVGSTLLARGDSRRILRLHMLIDPPRIVAYIAGMYFFPSVETFILILLIFQALAVPLAYRAKSEVQPTDYRQLTTALLRSAVATAPAAGTALAFLVFANGIEVHYLAWIAPVYCAAWLAGLVVCRHPIRHEWPINRVVGWLPSPPPSDRNP